MPERWLSVDEIATHLGVNPDTIYKWITRKSMPAFELGWLWKFLVSEVGQSLSASSSNIKKSRKQTELQCCYGRKNHTF